MAGSLQRNLQQHEQKHTGNQYFLQRMPAAVQFDFILTKETCRVGEDKQPMMNIFFPEQVCFEGGTRRFTIN